ncbi:hypothetical protein BDBG_17660 [Blastomyces gilchristii SLH14081]|uniref:Protein kinase domain-containing protein n=1 Tax=Blastomyces gilchristii (strain SLH14081) TaxID=559298 RepID=A0A179UZ70_BLAGS|nr:uncharacterized protein BDBG_17660 [Blastomyces gilchristii SLH14081]OAT12341.1 hypothetical protein BDBG_17660 [Blastomyces gilchristii SLH14081]
MLRDQGYAYDSDSSSGSPKTLRRSARLANLKQKASVNSSASQSELPAATSASEKENLLADWQTTTTRRVVLMQGLLAFNAIYQRLQPPTSETMELYSIGLTPLHGPPYILQMFIFFQLHSFLSSSHFSHLLTMAIDAELVIGILKPRYVFESNKNKCDVLLINKSTDRVSGIYFDLSLNCDSGALLIWDDSRLDTHLRSKNADFTIILNKHSHSIISSDTILADLGKISTFEVLSSGTSGTVFNAVDCYGKFYTVKMLKSFKDPVDNETAKVRFDKESKALQNLDHDNIISVMEEGMLIVISNLQTFSSSSWSLLLLFSLISGSRRGIVCGPFAVLIFILKYTAGFPTRSILWDHKLWFKSLATFAPNLDPIQKTLRDFAGTMLEPVLDNCSVAQVCFTRIDSIMKGEVANTSFDFREHNCHSTPALQLFNNITADDLWAWIHYNETKVSSRSINLIKICQGLGLSRASMRFYLNSKKYPSYVLPNTLRLKIVIGIYLLHDLEQLDTSNTTSGIPDPPSPVAPTTNSDSNSRPQPRPRGKSVRGSLGRSTPRALGSSVPADLDSPSPRAPGGSVPADLDSSSPRALGSSVPADLDSPSPRAPGGSVPADLYSSSPRALGELVHGGLDHSSPRAPGDSTQQGFGYGHSPLGGMDMTLTNQGDIPTVLEEDIFSNFI